MEGRLGLEDDDLSPHVYDLPWGMCVCNLAMLSSSNAFLFSKPSSTPALVLAGRAVLFMSVTVTASGTELSEESFFALADVEGAIEVLGEMCSNDCNVNEVGSGGRGGRGISGGDVGTERFNSDFQGFRGLVARLFKPSLRPTSSEPAISTWPCELRERLE